MKNNQLSPLFPGLRIALVVAVLFLGLTISVSAMTDEVCKHNFYDWHDAHAEAEVCGWTTTDGTSYTDGDYVYLYCLGDKMYIGPPGTVGPCDASGCNGQNVGTQYTYYLTGDPAPVFEAVCWDKDTDYNGYWAWTNTAGLVFGPYTHGIGPHCGDGTCDLGETYTTCPQDCPYIPSCGNHICDSVEDCHNCPQDCGECPFDFLEWLWDIIVNFFKSIGLASLSGSSGSTGGGGG